MNQATPSRIPLRNPEEGAGDPPHVSFVIPAFNEEGILQETLETAHRFFSSRPYTYELLPIDDGSGDSTYEIASRFAETVTECRPIRNDENRGKGYTVRRGIEEARGDLVIFSDADLSTPVEESEKLLEQLNHGYDLVIGSRDLPGSDVRIRQPWYRETMGKIFNRIVRILVVGGFQDTQCGFKGFRREKILPVVRQLRINTFSFDVEILFVAKQLGLRIREEPVIWVNNPDTRVNALTDSIRMFIDLFKIRYYHLRGCYRKPAEELSSVHDGKIPR